MADSVLIVEHLFTTPTMGQVRVTRYGDFANYGDKLNAR